MQIYHNPRCSKSRQTLELIRAAGQEPEIIEYLKSPPNPEQLKELLKLLGISAAELARKKEAAFSELNLKNAGEDELLAAMSQNPKLIERPIVVSGQRAVLGRPPENVQALL